MSELETPDLDSTLVADDAHADPVDAHRLGRYVLLHRLGEGGMGVVHAAYDDKLDRKVAIKLLRSRGGGEQARHRLVREAQALARLSHPNVVQIYEIAEVSNFGVEQAYLVMEFVDGVTLGAWLKSEARTRAAILDAFLGAARGLAAAHAAALVHRDFKPDNVMVRHDGRILVMDFGLAYADGSIIPTERGERTDRADRSSDDHHTTGNKLAEHLTATGAMMGTPAYMAPEQFLGRPTDAQTDQFGFCVALWEALFGQRPFAGRDLASLSLAVTGGEISRPERSDVPGWLREVIERGLATDPTKRWPSMQALIDALGRDPTHQRRVVVASLATVGIALAVVVGLRVRADRQQTEALQLCESEGRAIEVDWNANVREELEARFTASGLAFGPSAWKSTDRWMDEYAREWTRVRTETCVETRVDRTRDEASFAQVVECLDERRATFVGLTAAWDEVDPHTLTRATLAAAELPSVSACIDERALAHQPTPPPESRDQVSALRVRLDRVRALSLAGKLAPAFAAAESVLADAVALGWQPLVSEARGEFASLQEDVGQPELAYPGVQLAAQEALASGHDTQLLNLTITLSSMANRLARHADAAMWAQFGISLITRLELADTAYEAQVLTALGTVEEATGDLDGALELHTRALAIRSAVFGPDHPEVASSLDNIGVVQSAKGEYESALDYFGQALTIRAATLGSDHLEVAYSLNSTGGVQMQQGKLDEALATFERSGAITSAILGPDHVELAAVHNNIGVIHWQRGDYEPALVAFRKARVVLEKVLGPDHPRVASTIDNLGNVLLSRGAYDEALVAHRRALAIREKALGPDHGDVASSLNNLGTVFAELGDDGSALDHFTRAHAIWTVQLGEDHPFTATALTNVADVSTRRGDFDKALEMYARSLTGLETSLGPEHMYVAYPLVGTGRARLGLGQIAEARTSLDRALAIRTAGTAPPAELAEVRFLLARVESASDQPDRARELAQTARDGYVEAGLGSEAELREVVEWLADH